VRLVQSKCNRLSQTHITVGKMFRSFALAALAAAPCDGTSIGDRLVLEEAYLQKYHDMPLSADAALEEGWVVSEDCEEGLGRRAEGGPTSGPLHLWFDRSGAIMGYGVTIDPHLGTLIAPKPWKRAGNNLQMDFLFREKTAACSHTATAVAGSIGDRLLVDVENDDPVQFPMTLAESQQAGFMDGGDCWTDMGKHMVYNHWLIPPIIGPIMGLYRGDDNTLQGINAPSLTPRDETPPYEYFDLHHGGPVHGFHIYFREHQGSCGSAPTKPPFDAAAVV